MKKLSVISLVAASLVMGSGMAVAKSKKYKNDYNDYSYKDQPYYENDFAPRKRAKHRRHGWHNYGCLPPRKIRRRLAKRGWHDFYIVRMNPRIIKVRATNFNGRRFVLRLDRCDGYILSRRPLRRFWRY